MKTVTMTGTIKFDPKDKTKKHAKQASWKKLAMVIFDGDVTEYYGWLIKRRYNLQLNKPLRGGHITFISIYCKMYYCTFFKLKYWLIWFTVINILLFSIVYILSRELIL